MRSAAEERRTGMKDIVNFRFRAFISYSHANSNWAKWLHSQLERFHIGKDIAGRVTPTGVIPKTLRPIFRDRDDFTAGHTLTEQTLAALDGSAALIVLCSPQSATSRYVNEEVRLFKWRHPDRPIIPVIVDGKPGDAMLECFAPALRFQLTADGALTNNPDEVLAADVRDEGDGRNLAVAKTVARLLGLQTDEVVRRAERDRRRGARIRNAIVACLALLTIAASGSAVMAWRSAAARETMLVRAIDITNALVQQVVALRDYVPKAVVETMLGQADKGFSDLLDSDSSNAALMEKYALMLLEFSRHYNALGLAANQHERAGRAHQIFAALHEKDHRSSRYRHGLAAALTEIGNAEITLGNLASAEQRFEKARQLLLAGITIRNPKTAPSEELGRQRLLVSPFGSNVAATRSVGPRPLPQNLSDDELRNGWGAAKITIRSGDVAFEQGNFQAALQHFDQAYSAINSMRQSYGRSLTPEADDGMAYDLGVTQIRTGDVYRESSKSDLAAEAYDRALRLFASLHERKSGNKDYERMEAVTYARRGLVWRQVRDHEKSKADLRRAIAVYENLLGADPANSGWKRDLQVTLGNLGETLLAAGEAPEAKAVFLRSEMLAKEIVRLDETNKVWRNDLAIASMQVGLTALRLGDVDEARSRFRWARAELQQLVRLDPLNEIWRLELESLEALIATLPQRRGS